MFPQNPSFICRRCCHSFFIESANVQAVINEHKFKCPNCNYIEEAKGIKAFFKYYPRLHNAQVEFKLAGVKFLGWDKLTDIMGLGVYHLLKANLVFHFSCCLNTSSFLFDSGSQHYRDKPKSFTCPSCKTTELSYKTVQEFFRCLNQVHDSSLKLTHFQWDLFKPINLSVPLNSIQSKINGNVRNLTRR